MKKIWLKLTVIFLVIWGVSVAFSALITSKPDPVVVIKESKPETFKLVRDESILRPVPKGIRTQSAIVVDLDSGTVILGKNEDRVRSIASLTKLATALVFLGTSPDMERIDTVTAGDRRGAGRSRLRVGTSATLDDFFHLMLICSDNVAARVIARSAGVDSAQFVARMNELAKALKLRQTCFADPTGLDAGNVSTASELAILFRAALDKEQISEAVGRREYTFRAVNGRRTYTLHNTNRLLGRRDVIGGKTGYILESGYCLALRVDDGVRKLGAVLLGAPTNGCRYRDAARLLTCLKAPSETSRQAGIQ